jgi:hypothetical protein
LFLLVAARCAEKIINAPEQYLLILISLAGVPLCRYPERFWPKFHKKKVKYVSAPAVLHPATNAAGK